MIATVMPNRDQLHLLREARVMIKNEFGDAISLSSKEIFSQIYQYSLRSEHEKLFQLYRQILAVGEQRQPATTSTAKKPVSKTSYRGAPLQSQNAHVAGKKRAATYRGALVG